MVDIIIEIARFIIVGAIILYLHTSGKKENINRHAGWGYIMAGFVILLFGMFIDITDNFPALNRFVVIGDTPYQSFLEKVVGYLIGIILIAIGLWKWVPSIIKLKETEKTLKILYQELEKLNLGLEERVEQRTHELSKANTLLKRKMDELKHAEGALGESEKCYRQLIKEMLNGFALHEIVYDKTGKPCDYRFLEVNKAFEDMTGLKAKDIIGKTVLEVLPQTEQRWIDNYGKVATSGNPFVFENYSVEFNKHFEALAYCPKTDHFATVFTDITVRKESEERLKRSEEKYRSMMESMKEEVYICSSDFHIQYMNPAAISRIGRDATREPCNEAIYSLNKRCSWCMFDEVLQGKNAEYELLNPETKRYYRISNSPIRNIDGSLSKLTVCRDITDVKNMEQQLQQAIKMEAIGTLAGGVAHEFNNALSVIIGNIDLLDMDFPSDKNIANSTKAMKASAHRMAHLSDQLLAYARGGKYQAKTVSFCSFVKETLPLVKYTIDSAIDIATDLPRDIIKIKADPTQMQMVLAAVLSNASEAMEGKKGRIRISCGTKMITKENSGDFPGVKPGNYISLEIEDDGQGVDEETKNRIFEPFFTTKFEGRGLGMAAAYGIVKNHDGWISVDSELGKGTIVKIYLPAIESIQASLPEVEISDEEDGKSKTEWIKGTGTILIIEDEELVMNISREILERLGYRVLEARTGQVAIDVVKTFDGNIDLALLDIVLPDMSGNDIYPLIMEARPDLKVIVFSGYSIDGPAREILNAGAEDFIQKPLAVKTLSEKLKKLLGGGK